VRTTVVFPGGPPPGRCADSQMYVRPPKATRTAISTATSRRGERFATDHLMVASF